MKKNEIVEIYADLMKSIFNNKPKSILRFMEKFLIWKEIKIILTNDGDFPGCFNCFNIWEIVNKIWDFIKKYDFK